MARLKRNRRNGDSTVDVVGFSRGAAIAISFANEVAEELPDQRIRLVGVFDVVGYSMDLRTGDEHVATCWNSIVFPRRDA